MDADPMKKRKRFGLGGAKEIKELKEVYLQIMPSDN
jgi:hypothetical protein